MLITDGDLRAYLDGEVDDQRRAEIERALEQEPALARRLEDLRASSAWTSGMLGLLDHAETPVDAEAALADLPLGRKPARRPILAWAAVAASLLLVGLLFTWQPARGMATHLLGLLRIESVAVLEVDRSMFRATDSQVQMFAQALSETVEKIKEPGPPREAESRDQAAEWAKLDLRLPAGQLQQPQLLVSDSSAIQMQVDLVRVERMIDVIGGSDVEVPERMDGAVVRVDVYESVRARYGDCWGEPRKKDPGCMQLVQGRAPSVVTTPELDLEEVARLGLQVAGVSEEDAVAMTSTIDWASTLVLPIPKGKVLHEDIDVDGVRGVLVVKEKIGDANEYAILWVKNGVTYVLGGYGDWGPGLQAANSLE